MGVKSLKIVVVVGFFVCFGVFFVYNVLTHKDPHIQHIKSFSRDTTYIVERVKPENMQIPQSGRLGALYSCLTKYGALGSRKMTRPNNGIEEWIILRLDDRTKVDILINAMEGFQFGFELYDKNNEYLGGSSRYAINCDMELLNKPDSDMHCEDKVLGNEIRPVCTYRPQQPPSQDDAKG